MNEMPLRGSRMCREWHGGRFKVRQGRHLGQTPTWKRWMGPGGKTSEDPTYVNVDKDITLSLVNDMVVPDL